ncbi:MAG TPA: glucuronyl hydrolase [Chloroflexi bacterium]|nr:glucuronyl hydrolase [Chloroflexota bacterium]
MTNHIPSPSWLDDALEFCIVKTRHNLATLTDFPERTEGGQWIQIAPEQHGWWVGGHWVGLLWLAYAASGDPALSAAAHTWAGRLLPQLNDQSDHDLGFLFELGFVLGYRLTGDESLKPSALQAASILSRRFNPRGQFIQAWGSLDASPELRGRTIMDTMMNLDLLFWAAKETGNSYYAEIAAAHARTTLIHHLRADGSTSHVCDFDPETGAFIKQGTHQGLSATSCWSRGQAWGVYGFADCYRATGDPIFLNASRRLMVYLWPRLPADLVPFWDYDSPLIPNDVRDSSAASVLAAGLLSLAAVENDPNLASIWQNRAISILEALWKTYTSLKSGEACLLLHGTRSKPHNLMDHGLIYGDYYFVEALMRLSKPKLSL